jgi:hypothetical protein
MNIQHHAYGIQSEGEMGIEMQLDKVDEKI